MFFLFLLFFTVADIADAADLGIKPTQTHVLSPEGSNITLSCTYTGSVYYLFWYQQTPGSRPEFLLMIDEATGNSHPPHPRFSIINTKKENKVDLHISSAAVTDSALFYCALNEWSGNQRLIFGSAMNLKIYSQEKVSPQYYKVRYDDKESCLATGFTNHSETDGYWPDKTKHAAAVRFSGQEYYSRLILNNVDNCTETECSHVNTESGGVSFLSDAKTRFMAFSVFWLRVLFLKTIAFNILMTLKFWMS